LREKFPNFAYNFSGQPTAKHKLHDFQSGKRDISSDRRLFVRQKKIEPQYEQA